MEKVLVDELTKKLENMLQEPYLPTSEREAYKNFRTGLINELYNAIRLSYSQTNFYTPLQNLHTFVRMGYENTNYFIYVNGIFYNPEAMKEEGEIKSVFKKIGYFFKSLGNIYNMFLHGETPLFYYSYILGEIELDDYIRHLMKTSYSLYSLLACLEIEDSGLLQNNGNESFALLIEKRPILVIPGLSEEQEKRLKEWEERKTVHYKISEKGWFKLIPHEDYYRYINVMLK